MEYYRTNLNEAGNIRVNVTLRCVRETIVVVEKQLSITCSGCVFVTLVIQQAKRMRLIICGLSDSTIFFTLSDKRHDFRKKVIEHEIVF